LLAGIATHGASHARGTDSHGPPSRDPGAGTPARSYASRGPAPLRDSEELKWRWPISARKSSTPFSVLTDGELRELLGVISRASTGLTPGEGGGSAPRPLAGRARGGDVAGFGCQREGQRLRAAARTAATQHAPSVSRDTSDSSEIARERRCRSRRPCSGTLPVCPFLPPRAATMSPSTSESSASRTRATSSGRPRSIRRSASDRHR
jgi:hypothetical protein